MQNTAHMSAISPARLNLLRAIYLLIAVAQGFNTWPAILNPARAWEMNEGLVLCMMGSLTALSLLGLRYPLKMLPLLFWEIGFKTLWLVIVALPAYLSGNVDVAMATTTFACGLVIIVYLAVPWDYVVSSYVRHRGDPWLKSDLRRAK